METNNNFTFLVANEITKKIVNVFFEGIKARFPIYYKGIDWKQKLIKNIAKTFDLFFERSSINKSNDVEFYKDIELVIDRLFENKFDVVVTNKTYSQVEINKSRFFDYDKLSLSYGGDIFNDNIALKQGSFLDKRILFYLLMLEIDKQFIIGSFDMSYFIEWVYGFVFPIEDQDHFETENYAIIEEIIYDFINCYRDVLPIVELLDKLIKK